MNEMIEAIEDTLKRSRWAAASSCRGGGFIIPIE